MEVCGINENPLQSRVASTGTASTYDTRFSRMGPLPLWHNVAVTARFVARVGTSGFNKSCNGQTVGFVHLRCGVPYPTRKRVSAALALGNTMALAMSSWSLLGTRRTTFLSSSAIFPMVSVNAVAAPMRCGRPRFGGHRWWRPGDRWETGPFAHTCASVAGASVDPSVVCRDWSPAL